MPDGAVRGGGMLVSGLVGRAAVANGLYRCAGGSRQHRRSVYTQANAAPRGPSRLVYDKTPGEEAAWMVELPDDPGKAYAYCEDAAPTPDAVGGVWQVWECALTAPIEHGKWHAEPGFRVVAVEQRPDPEPPPATRAAAPVLGLRPTSSVQAPASIEVRNHWHAEYNGQYNLQGVCEGYPYYSNRAGKHLFRPVGLRPDVKQWLLSSKLELRDNVCEGYIECADAAPPLGRRRWQLWDTAINRWASCELEFTEDHVARLGSSARDRHLAESAAGQGQGFRFNRTSSTSSTDAAASPRGGGSLSRTLSGGSGAAADSDDEARALHLSFESKVEDDRRQEACRLAAEDAVAMGFDAELVAQVQAQGKYDTLDSLIEKLAELTREAVEPEPEREDDYTEDVVYSSASTLELNWAGLPNPSNYCFLNATVQCLRHTPGFANMLSVSVGDKAGSKFRGRPATLLEAFVLLLRRMEDGHRRPVYAKSTEWQDFIAQCKEQLPVEPDEDGRLTTLVHLKRQPQQDAGEFLLQVLDRLSQDRVAGNAQKPLVLERRGSHPVVELEPNYGDQMGARLTRAKSSPEAERRLLDEYIERQWLATKDTTRRTKLGALFQGQELTYKLCNKRGCGLFSPSSADPVLVEELHCLHLAGRDRATLQELLSCSSEAETPEDFACDRCKSKGTTTMARVLVKLPKVLVIRLNRALPDDRRVNCSIEFPDTLDMSKRLLSGRQCVGYTGGQCQPTYNLFAAVFHEGRSVRSGHYLAYVRSGASGTPSAARSRTGGSAGTQGIWVCCDDDEIVNRDTSGGLLSPQREERDRAGGRATLLFYERETSTPI